MTISSGVMTFTVAQTGDIGVGDVVLANSIEYMIVGKTSQTIWSVRNINGTSASNVGTPTAVTSIKRAFNALADALDGTASSSGIYGEIGTSNLVSNTFKIYLACYDDGDDTSLTKINGDWTCNSSYNFIIYTPTNTTNQCNNSQRHDGTYDGDGYTLKSTDGSSYHWNIGCGINDLKIYGLRVIRTSSNWSYGAGIAHNYQNFTSGKSGIRNEVAFNAMFSDSGADSSGAIFQWVHTGSDSGYGSSIHDNFIGSYGTVNEYGIEFSANYQTTASRQMKIYNNTIVGSYDNYGFEIDVGNSSGSSYLPLIKNNYVYSTDSTADYGFIGSDYSNATSNFAYNKSDDTSAGTANNNGQVSLANAAFVNTTYATMNLHLQSSSSLRNAGIGKSSDSNVSQYDIDGDDRGAASTTTDVGADFYPSAVSVHVPQHIFQAKGAI